MGLDNFWENVNEEQITFDPPLNLCGGMFSANGKGSFRGACYYQFIEEVTGISLYEDKIPNETVTIMASQLRSYLELSEEQRKFQLIGMDGYIPTEEETNDLVRMFETYSNAGAELVSWW